jgi:hypothetical protein
MRKMICFTFNPEWIEIEQELLLTGQTLSGHVIPDNVMAKVFLSKLRDLLINLVKHSLMGRVSTFKYTIEFQRRGLPQALILLTMASPLDSPNEIIYFQGWDKGISGGSGYISSPQAVWGEFTRSMITPSQWSVYHCLPNSEIGWPLFFKCPTI